MKLEIGGGSNRREGYLNVDPTVHGDYIDAGTDLQLPGGQTLRREVSTSLQCRIQDGVDLPDGCAEHVYASHVFEHIPKQYGELIVAMNEVHRLLMPGGEFEMIGPVVGYTDHEGDGQPHYAGWQPWADPTHVTFWWYPESWWYFTGGPAGNFRAHADYGIRYWTEVSSELRDGWEARVVLMKPL